MSKYSDKLKDPRWQKKRLEIFQRDNFTCRWCGEKEEQLNVHHLFYERNREPWETDDINLITLCSHCHEDEHENRKEWEAHLLDLLRQYDWSVVQSAAAFIFYLHQQYQGRNFQIFFDKLTSCIQHEDFCGYVISYQKELSKQFRMKMEKEND